MPSLNATITRFAFRDESEDSLLFKDLSLSIRQAEIASLVGPSGAGKSTLARILTGLLSPADCFSGRVDIDGEEVRPSTSLVSLVLQDYKRAVFPWLTVRANLLLGSRGAEGADQRLTQVLDWLDLSSIKGQRAERLSGGQLQRVQIGRALMAGSRFLILDEPTSSLDVSVRRQVYTQLEEISRGDNVGILIITHEIDEALAISDRVLILATNRQSPHVLLKERSGLRGRHGASLWAARDVDALQLCAEVEEAMVR